MILSHYDRMIRSQYDRLIDLTMDFLKGVTEAEGVRFTSCRDVPPASPRNARAENRSLSN